jgi:hypothetical protein
MKQSRVSINWEVWKKLKEEDISWSKKIDDAKPRWNPQILYYPSAGIDFRSLVYFTNHHLNNLKEQMGIEQKKPNLFLFSCIGKDVRKLRKSFFTEAKPILFKDKWTTIIGREFKEIDFIPGLEDRIINPKFVNISPEDRCPAIEPVAFSFEAEVKGDGYSEIQNVVYIEHENIDTFEKFIIHQKIEVLYLCALREGKGFGSCGKSIIEWVYQDQIKNEELHTVFNPQFVILFDDFTKSLFLDQNEKFNLGYKEAKYFNFPSELNDDLLRSRASMWQKSSLQ